MKHVAVSRPLVTRAQIENHIETLIALLDDIDGDPEIEFNGDKRDGSTAEDDFWTLGPEWASPGCPVSDPGGDEEVLASYRHPYRHKSSILFNFREQPDG